LKQQSSSSSIQYNGQVGTQRQNIQTTLKTYDCPILIKQKIEEKRRLNRDWHRLRTPESKRLLNTATKELKHSNIPARSYTNRIPRLFPVEGDQTGQETFFTTKDIRNLGKKRCRKGTRFH
jgi:hypothetical protein